MVTALLQATHLMVLLVRSKSNITKRNQLASGTVPTGRLTGTYNISISGNAATSTSSTNASNVRVDQDNSTNTTRYLLFTPGSSTTGIRPNLDINLTYNPALNRLIAGSFQGDGSQLTNLPQEIPAGTRMIFQQPSAPTGWTRIESGIRNDSALRINRLGTNWNDAGGNLTFRSVFTDRSVPLLSHNHGANTSFQPAHNHPIGIRGVGNHSHGGRTGGGGNHSHSYDKSSGNTRSGSGDRGGSSQRSRTSGEGSHGHPIGGDGQHNHGVDFGTGGGHGHTFRLTPMVLLMRKWTLVAMLMLSLHLRTDKKGGFRPL